MRLNGPKDMTCPNITRTILHCANFADKTRGTGVVMVLLLQSLAQSHVNHLRAKRRCRILL